MTLGAQTRPRVGAKRERELARLATPVLRREGIFIHRGRLHQDDRAVSSGLPVTTVARTLFDLAEFVSLKRLESAWEEADRLNLLELNAVEQVCERGYGRRALKPIRRLLAEARAPEPATRPSRSPATERCASPTAG
jgi:hypothetical protein